MLSATPSMSDSNREPAPSSPPFSRQSRLRRPHEDEDESSRRGGGDVDGDVVVAVSAEMLDSSSDGASQVGAQLLDSAPVIIFTKVTQGGSVHACLAHHAPLAVAYSYSCFEGASKHLRVEARQQRGLKAVLGTAAVSVSELI